MSVTRARDCQSTETRSDRIPLWVTGVSLALLALGFSRSGADPTRSNPSSHKREDRAIASRAGHGRGRAATHPLQVPARGWKDILTKTG